MHGHKTSHLPIRYFLALLWAHPILHISTIRVNYNIFISYFLKKYVKKLWRGHTNIQTHDQRNVSIYNNISDQWRNQQFCSGVGGGQHIQLKAEDREKGDLGAVAP